MIKKIKFSQILPLWKNELWPDRISVIETNSAMSYLNGYNIENMNYEPTFFGYFIGRNIIGVNSGHTCKDNSYRSRGLWVNKEYRNKGIGKLLLLETITQAKLEKCSTIWSYPRKTSWPTYKSVGFELTSKWHKSETSEANAYCILFL